MQVLLPLFLAWSLVPCFANPLAHEATKVINSLTQQQDPDAKEPEDEEELNFLRQLETSNEPAGMTRAIRLTVEHFALTPRI